MIHRPRRWPDYRLLFLLRLPHRLWTQNHSSGYFRMMVSRNALIFRVFFATRHSMFPARSISRGLPHTKVYRKKPFLTAYIGRTAAPVFMPIMATPFDVGTFVPKSSTNTPRDRFSRWSPRMATILFSLGASSPLCPCFH